MDNRRLFIAALLSLAVLLVWQWLFPPPPPVTDTAPDEMPRPSAATAASGDDAAPPALDEPGPELETPRTAREVVRGEVEQLVSLESDRFVATWSSRGGVLVSFRSKARRDSDGEMLELVRQRPETAPFPFALVRPDGEPLPINQELFAVEQDDRSVSFRRSGPEGAVEKRFDIVSELLFEYAVDAEGLGTWGVLLGPGVRNPAADELDDRFQKRFRQATVAADDELTDWQASKVDEPVSAPQPRATWLGLEDKYFLTALVPATPLSSVRVLPVRVGPERFETLMGQGAAEDEDDDGPRDLALVLEPLGDTLSGSAYWGAKEHTTLRRVGHGLEQSVRWGFFGFIAKPLLYGLRWLHANVVANYGWCIVLMTLLIRLVLLPLTHTSYVSMQKMQKLNPRMEAIRKRYRPKLRDKQGRPNFEMQRKMNEEIQALFKEEKVNPAAGCMPLLLQMPIFFGFYQLLASAVELWGAPWALWIHDLSRQDPYYVLPLVMGATQLVQTKMMPTPPNPGQRIIMTTMPIWFTVFALGFPSGLVLYWLTNNVLTIIQQGGYNRLKKAGVFGGGAEAAARKA